MSELLNTIAMDNPKVIVIRRFATTGEALIYKTLLESNGIDAELMNETSSEVLPLQSDLMEVKLAVREADVPKAEAILAAQFDQNEFETESKKRRKKP